MRLRMPLVTFALSAALGLGAAGTAPAAAEPGGAEPSARGEWSVTAVEPGRYVVRWTADEPLPITSDRPRIVDETGAPVGETVLVDEGRAVEVAVAASEAPDPDDLDVLLSGDRLDEAGDDLVAGPEATPSAAPDDEVLPVDPAEPGPYPIERSNYKLDPVKLTGMKNPIEMVGHVVEPAAGAAVGDRPLVLFLHGRHSVCYIPGDPEAMPSKWPCQAPAKEIPSHLGYDYAQEVLASQGYATVSIRVNGINAQDWRLPDGGAGARASIVIEHLKHWAGMAAEHKVDLDRVVLVGHSRGGEGVNRASIRIPLDADYRIVGQVLLAPTNFATQTSPYVPSATVLPYCDGDVSDLQGQKFVDFARDLTADDTSLKSAVLMMGANHNYFNTEWTPGVAKAPAWDDWGGPATRPCGTSHPGRLSDAEQRTVGLAWIAGAVRLFAADEEEFLPLYDGSHATVASVGDADIRSAAIGGGRDVRRPAIDAEPTTPSGAAVRLCDAERNYDEPGDTCAADDALPWLSPNWPDAWEELPVRSALEVAWSQADATGGLQFYSPLDASDGRLELRVIADPSKRVRFDVRVTDTDGDSATLTPVGGTTFPGLPTGKYLARLWAQTVPVELGDAAIDTSAIESVELVARTDSGRAWLLDVAAAPGQLSAVPSERLPLVNIRSVKVPEGDGPGKGTATIPVKLRGTLSEPARLQLVRGAWTGKPKESELTLNPGDPEHGITVKYPRDDVWTPYPWMYDVRLVPLAGAMTDSYLGMVQVVEDDPAPKLRVKPVAKRVKEGQRARFKISLSQPVGEVSWASLTVVKGTGRPLHTADVPKKWLEERVGKTKKKFLYKAGLYVNQRLPKGKQTTEISIPIAKDNLREKPETLTVKVRYYNMVKKVSVTVVDP